MPFLPKEPWELARNLRGKSEETMKIAKKSTWMTLCAVATLLAGQAAWAQTTTVPARVVSAVDDTQTVTLKGNVHPLAQAKFDQGAVSDATPATRMMLVLQRSAQQETALRQLMDQQQDKTSANYHAWLTPAQFGTQFGPADADVQAVTDWLQSHGFQNVKVGAGRTTIEFSGNVGQVRNAFHTDIHQFLVHGEQHMANVSDPQIPAALAPVLGGVVGPHNFRPKSLMHRAKNYLGGHVTGTGPKPQVTFACTTGPCYGVAPADFVKIYNLPGNLTGAGVTIAIVQDSDVYVTDIQQFNTLFGLTTNFSASNIIPDGPDPGVQNTITGNGDEGEAVLDVEWSGAVAPGATIDLVVTQDPVTIGTPGVALTADYIIQNNLAPILSLSFGSCEAGLGTANEALYNLLWEQAAAQGITAVVATGDNGSDMCDDGDGNDYSTTGLGINGVASTPFNVALGGTDFQTTGLASYWSATNGTPPESANSYIPESTWNSGCAATATTGSSGACTATIINQNENGTNDGIDMLGGGGGQSAFPTINAKPAWQVGLAPSADTGRDIPDLALFAAVNSSSNVFYITCQQDSSSQIGNACSLPSGGQPEISPVGGTSAAAPAFAGIMALIIQNAGGARQGNANYVLYQLYNKNKGNANTICTSNAANATATGCIFYDVVTGNNSVACASGTPNCGNVSNGYGVLVDPSATTTPAFTSVAGYDKATGLGSVNVTNLAKNWGSVSFTPDTAAITTYPGAAVPHGTNQDFTVTVTSGSGTPTGFVSLVATPTTPAGSAPVGIGAFTNTSTSTFELVNGTATITTNLLPGGTDSVVAEYGGDGTFAPATSTAVPVTVSPETSKTTLSWWTSDSNGYFDVSLPAGSTVVYGTTPYILRVDVTNSAGTQCENGTVPCPTGTITETYGNNLPLNDFPNGQTGVAVNYATLNVLGFLEDLPINLPVGNNQTVTAQYKGDNSYSGSSNSIGLSVSQAQTETLVGSNFSIVTSGETVTLTAYVVTNSSGAGPGNTVQFLNGSTPLGSAVTCQSISGTQDTAPPIAQIGIGTAYCKVTTQAAISALFPPGTVRPGPPGVPIVPLVVALASLLLFGLGFRWMPEGRRRAYGNIGLVAFVLLVVGVAGCGGGSGGGGGGGSTTVTIYANYNGDTNYMSSSGSTQITIQ